MSKRRHDRIRIRLFAFKMKRVFRERMELRARTIEERLLNAMRYTINAEIVAVHESIE